MKSDQNPVWNVAVNVGADIELHRHKSRLVAKSFNQVFNLTHQQLDFQLLEFCWLGRLKQMDTKAAHLNAPIEEDVYKFPSNCSVYH